MITLNRRQIVLLALPLVGLLVLAGSRLARTGAATGPEAAPLVATGRAEARASAASPLFVHVVGAVRRAGLYRLRDGARVADAVRRAGGPTHRADVGLVNLAAPLVDGMQVVVPARPDAAPGTGSTAAQSAAATVSLGSATVEQLDELPGIGPVTAQKIIDWRTSHGPFASVDDLDDVPGIGPARIEQLRELVTP